MTLNCPNCQASVETLNGASVGVLCPSCGISLGDRVNTTADWNPGTTERRLGKMPMGTDSGFELWDVGKRGQPETPGK
jgi:hypothetical protein